jgi:CHASE2 domain-containing sensor protein
MIPGSTRKAMRRDVARQALVVSMLLTATVTGLYFLIRGTVYQMYEDLSYPRFLDFGYQVRASAIHDPDVCIVAIDSLPVNHTKLAMALAVIKQCRPKAIGVDVVLDRAASPGDTLLGRELESTIPVVLACEFKGNTMLVPDSLYCHPNVRYGHAYLRYTNQDEIVRWFTSYEKWGDAEYPSFATEVAQCGGTPVTDTFTPGSNYLINYAGEYDQFGFVGLDEVLTARNRSGLTTLLSDRYVLIGYCAEEGHPAPTFRDLFRTPFTSNENRALEGRMYGVEVHANILHTVLNGRKISEWGVWPGVGISFLLLILNFVGQSVFINWSRRARRRLFWIALGVEFVLLVTMPLLLFLFTDQTLDVTIPLIALLIFPKAESLYYRYIDNIGVRWHGRRLRKLPPFLTGPFLEIYKASTLGERLSTALNAGAILLSYCRFVADPEKPAPDLGNSTKDLEYTLAKGRLLHEKYRRVAKERMTWGQPEANPWTGQDGFHPSPSDMQVSVAPYHGRGVYYENYFLEVMAAIKEVFARLRPAFVGGPLKGGLNVEADCVSMEFRGSRLVLSPFIEYHVCTMHDVPETFVHVFSWDHAGTGDGFPEVWLGVTPACCRLDETKSVSGGTPVKSTMSS